MAASDPIADVSEAGNRSNMQIRAEQLLTSRLRLRRPRKNGVNAIHAIMSHAQTMQYWSSTPHASLSETAAWFDGMLKADEAGQSDEFVIEYRGEVIGKLGAWRLPEIGFFIRQDHCGRGFGSEALAAFIDYARSRNVPSLLVDVDPDNGACIFVLTNAGFREYRRAFATYAIADRVCDSVYLRLDLLHLS